MLYWFSDSETFRVIKRRNFGDATGAQAGVKFFFGASKNMANPPASEVDLPRITPIPSLNFQRITFRYPYSLDCSTVGFLGTPPFLRMKTHDT